MRKQKPFNVGLVVGKLSPPHLGHKYLIDTAIANCNHVVLIGYSNPPLGISSKDKFEILKRNFPSCSLIVAWDWCSPPNDAHELVHRKYCADLLKTNNIKPIDAVFSSEIYGDGFAEYLTNYFTHQCKSVILDINRTTVDVSATRIRNDPANYSKFKLS